MVSTLVVAIKHGFRNNGSNLSSDFCRSVFFKFIHGKSNLPSVALWYASHHLIHSNTHKSIAHASTYISSVWGSLRLTQITTQQFLLVLVLGSIIPVWVETNCDSSRTFCTEREIVTQLNKELYCIALIIALQCWRHSDTQQFSLNKQSRKLLLLTVVCGSGVAYYSDAQFNSVRLRSGGSTKVMHHYSSSAS